MHTLRDKACIVGIGETAYRRRNTQPAPQMVFEAVQKACDDAGIRVQDIDGIVQMSGGEVHNVSAKDVQQNFGIKDLKFLATAPVGAGTAVAGAAGIATMALDAGMCSNVIVWHLNDWGVSTFSPGASHDVDHHKHDFETPFGWYGQPAHLAMCARRHMAEFGTRSEQLGSIAVKLREHAGLHGNAVYTDPITLDQYMACRFVAEPLRIYDCCVIADGAGAFVMTTPDRAKDLRKPPVYFMGLGMATNDRGWYWAQQPDLTHTWAVHSAPRAYEMAGVGPEDIDFLQAYDCFTWVVLSTIEDHGFCAKGEGGAFVEGGSNIGINGRLPVNTSGGMLSQAYLQGMNHLCEGVRQLRGEGAATQIPDAEIGLIGGYAGLAYASLILRKA